MIKNLLLFFVTPLLVWGQQNQDYSPENLEMPSTKWMDFADTSWYSPGQEVYEIYTAEELAGLAQIVGSLDENWSNFQGKTIHLMNDIDIGEHLWYPIGDGFGRFYGGSFNGNNHTISNLYINSNLYNNTDLLIENYNYYGLFGLILNGNIQNIKLENVNISEIVSSYPELIIESYVGSLVGEIYQGSIINCHANNVTITKPIYSGGLVGYLNGSIEKSSASNINITDVLYQVGGLVGYMWGDDAQINESYSSGEIKSEVIAGGLVGEGGGNNIQNSFSRVNVNVSADGQGGSFIGISAPYIKNSYATGKVTKTDNPIYPSGFVGIFSNSNTQNNYYNQESSPYSVAVGEFENSDDNVIIEIYGRDTAFMKTQAFVDELNLNAEDGPIWFMGEEWNDFYPILSGSLDVNDITQKVSSIKIYPNPVVNELHFKSAHPIQGVELFNVNGKLLKTMKSADKISVSHLPKGVYFLKIRSNNTTHFEKFIKK